jgi:prophage maintenance system killer protein
METLLFVNGFELKADVDEAEKVILDVAAGSMSRQDFFTWVQVKTVART